MGIIAFLFGGTLALILFLGVYLTWAFRRRAAYYKKHGIAYLGAGLNRNFRTLTGKLNFISLDEEIYKDAKATNAPIVAVSDITGQTSLVITDPDILRRIMVKDFDHFVNLREINTHQGSKYFTKMLFVLKDDQWKALRAKMTPAFSSGKIKRMFQLFSTSSQRMDKYVKEQMCYPGKTSMDVDFYKLLFKYSMDVIASVAFGVDSRSWDTNMDKFSTFEQFGKNFEVKFTAMTFLKVITTIMLPKVADWLELDLLDTGAQQYFAGIIQDVLKRRRQTGERRDDFLQLMIDIQQGTLKDEDKEIESYFDSAMETKVVFDDDYLIANALMFFLGGFDTTQTVLLFSVYSLVLEQEVQQKLYEEVKSVMDKNGGKITYDSLFEMQYLDMVIQETMRIFPAASRMERQCTRDYVVEENGFKIEKGTVMIIPTHGIHHDPKYYPDPEKFIPERFNAENKAARHPYTYLPWGHGPRSCIGMRFALLKVKTIIATLVSSYKLTPCSKTPIPVKFDGSVAAKPLGGMWLQVEVRE